MDLPNNTQKMDDFENIGSDSSIPFPILPKILIVGVGGAGNNCIHQLASKNISGIRTIAINTDSQQLNSINADCKVLIGTELTNGMGVGGDPELGMECAKASYRILKKLFEGVELVFLIAGMGGGTGSGAGPMIAEIARANGAVVIGVATKPFRFECGRCRRAEQGLRTLSASVHTLIIIDNNKLLSLVPDMPIDKAFNQINNLIAEIISGLTETMFKPSLINLDFADIKTIMKKGNLALMYYGESTTLDPDEIVRNTFNNPLLNMDYGQANGALIHITGGSDLSLELTTKITRNITKRLKPNSNVILGARIDPDYENEIRLLTIMTGIQPLNEYSNFLEMGNNMILAINNNLK